jgi:mannosylglucosylglycerate synthase
MQAVGNHCIPEVVGADRIFLKQNKIHNTHKSNGKYLEWDKEDKMDLALKQTGVLHFTAPPVVGGVESVIHAHAGIFLAHGHSYTVIAGRGEVEAMPEGTQLALLPRLDSQHPNVVNVQLELDSGQASSEFEDLTSRLITVLEPVLQNLDNLIVHNVFTKHFNLALTAALFRLLDAGAIRNCIAWCHDFSWTSPNSKKVMHAGYPWDLLRTSRPDLTYVVVSAERQQTLADLMHIPADRIQVIYNGVDPKGLLGLSTQCQGLIDRLRLLESELVLLMPVRVTKAKNIELAIKVVAALKQKGSKSILVLTGPPDPHDEGMMHYYHGLLDLRSRLGVDKEMRFVYESGPDPDSPFTIDGSVVGELFRLSDLLFMPSHREGFGMPVLEAGLAGIPVFSTPIPATEEIGRNDVVTFKADGDPDEIADQILSWAASSLEYRLRKRVRERYTWEAIFQRDIIPLLK